MFTPVGMASSKVLPWSDSNIGNETPGAQNVSFGVHPGALSPSYDLTSLEPAFGGDDYVDDAIDIEDGDGFAAPDAAILAEREAMKQKMRILQEAMAKRCQAKLAEVGARVKRLRLERCVAKSRSSF